MGFEKQQIRIINDEYWWGDEGPFTRVSNGSEAFDKSWLKHWYKKETARCAVEDYDTWKNMDPGAAIDYIKGACDRVGNKAMRAGTDLHTLLEDLGNGIEIPDYVLDSDPKARSAMMFFNDAKPEILMQELVVFSRKWKYAGRFDAIMRIAGVGTVMVDYKSSKKVSETYAAQLAGYANAEFIGSQDGTETPIPDLDGAYVLRLGIDEYEFVPVDIGERPFAWLRAGLIGHRMGRVQSEFLGTPLTFAKSEAGTTPIAGHDKRINNDKATDQDLETLKLLMSKLDPEQKETMKSFWSTHDLAPGYSGLTHRQAQMAIGAASDLLHGISEAVLPVDDEYKQELAHNLSSAGLGIDEDQKALARVVLGVLPRKPLDEKQREAIYDACGKIIGGEWILDLDEDGGLAGFTNAKTLKTVEITPLKKGNKTK